MPSSIFSSDRSRPRLLYQAALWCLGFLVGYSILVALWAPQVTIATSQWSLNRIKAERYLYATETPQVVILGTSLAMGLPDKELGPRVFNLSLGALGPLTGLEIIRQDGSRPSMVLIESNLFVRGIEEDLVDDLFFPGLHALRKWVLALRHEYQPVNVLVNAVGRHASRPNEPTAQERPELDTLSRMLEVHRHELSRPPAQAMVDAAVAKLTEFVGTLESKGVRVIFFEMPVDPLLQRSVVMTSNRQRLKEAFPASRFQWLNLDDHGPFRTRDGLHLIYPDAVRVARALIAAVNDGSARKDAQAR